MDSNETNLPPHIQELCDREDVAEFTDAEVGQLADFWFEDQLRKCPDNPALTGKQLRDISKLFSEQAIAGKHKLNKDTFHVFTDNVGNPWQCIVATDPEADGKHVGTFAICETERESKQPPARYVSTLYMYPTEHWQKAVPIAIAEAVVGMLSTMYMHLPAVVLKMPWWTDRKGKPMKLRPIPEVVDAIQFVGNNAEAVLAHLGVKLVEREVGDVAEAAIFTLHANGQVPAGAWLFRRHGVVTVVKNCDIDLEYEPAEE